MSGHDQTIREPSGIDKVIARNGAGGPKLGGQFGWVSVGRLLGAVIQAATLVLVARWAGPGAFGAVGVALSLVVILQTATDLGLPTFIIRERAALPANPDIARALQINNVTARCMAVLLLAIFALLGTTVEVHFIQLLPLAVWAATDRNTETWLGVTLADGDARINTLAILTRRILSIILMFGLYELGVPPLWALSVSLALVGYAANYLVHRLVSLRLTPSEKTANCRNILRGSRAYWVTSIATQLGNLDAVIVGMISGAGQVAFYAAASKVTGPLRILPNSMAVLLIPTVGRVGAAGLKSIARPVLIVLGSMIPLYCGVTLLAPVAVPWALGSDFAGAVLPLQIVCLGLTFSACAAILAAILVGLGRGILVARTVSLTTTLSLVGIAIGASVLASVGAAIALSLSFVVQSAMLAVALKRTRRGRNTGNRSRDVVSPGPH